jgi:hypothetical protein
MTYDLSSDPHEDWNLFDTELTHGWVFVPVFRLIGAYQQSHKKYPNIRPRRRFQGLPLIKMNRSPWEPFPSPFPEKWGCHYMAASGSKSLASACGTYAAGPPLAWVGRHCLKPGSRRARAA